MNKDKLLSVKNLSCGYGDKIVVSDISFEVSVGQKLIVLGANGCGKSTLLKALCGLLDYSGEVFACGADARAFTARERAGRIALMSQFQYAAFDFTVKECVAMGRYAHIKGGLFSADAAEDEEIIVRSMRFAGADGLAGRYLNELSGGQLQRVFLARVFAQDPQILLLDEPANHLDLAAQKQLTERICEWACEKERCVVGVFHDINLALSFADRILLMKDGKVLGLCGARELDGGLLNAAYGMDAEAYMRALCRRWTEK